jgi:hypothetical protein
MNKSKEVVTQVSIKGSPNGIEWNPIYNCIKVGPDDEAAGSFLRISGENEDNEGSSISLDWEEWDTLVEVVAKYRKDWEWK